MASATSAQSMALPEHRHWKLSLFAGLLVLLVLGVLMVTSNGGSRRFLCVIESDNRNGATLTFETGLNLLTWGPGLPKMLELQKHELEPLELLAVERGNALGRISIRIYGDGQDIRFVAYAGDFGRTGKCKVE